MDDAAMEKTGGEKVPKSFVIRRCAPFRHPTPFPVRYEKCAAGSPWGEIEVRVGETRCRAAVGKWEREKGRCGTGVTLSFELEGVARGREYAALAGSPWGQKQAAVWMGGHGHTRLASMKRPYAARLTSWLRLAEGRFLLWCAS